MSALSHNGSTDTEFAPIAHVGLVGTGIMAQGIARLLTYHGMETTICGREGRSANQFAGSLERWISSQLKKGKLDSDQAGRSLKCVRVRTDLSDLASVVIEAIAENLRAKQTVFRQLEQYCAPSITLASSTSSIQIADIASRAEHKGRIVGVHFMNPPHVMPLVEVVRSEWTNDGIVKTTLQLLTDLGKHPLLVPDIPGFVLNRILFSGILEAIRLLETGAMGHEEIDTAMRLGAGQPMGPLELADLIGLDVCLAILGNLEQDEISRFSPPQLLKKMVEDGNLGRKTGKGFYHYESR